MILRHALLRTLAGPLLATASEQGLRHLRILAEAHDYRPELARLWPTGAPDLVLREEPGHFLPLARQLGEYFGGLRQDFDLPLDPVGTAFQMDVWRRVARIRFGQLQTFGQLAVALNGLTAHARWARPWPRIRCRSWFPATAWSVSPATLGVSWPVPTSRHGSCAWRVTHWTRRSKSSHRSYSEWVVSLAWRARLRLD